MYENTFFEKKKAKPWTSFLAIKYIGMNLEPVTNCFQALTLYKEWNTLMRYCSNSTVIICFSFFHRVSQAPRHLVHSKKKTLIALLLEINLLYFWPFLSKVETFFRNAFGM